MNLGALNESMGPAPRKMSGDSPAGVVNLPRLGYSAAPWICRRGRV